MYDCMYDCCYTGMPSSARHTVREDCKEGKACMQEGFPPPAWRLELVQDPRPVTPGEM